MANILKMLRNAGALQREVARVQKELGRRTVEFVSADGAVRVEAACDLTVRRIEVAPSLAENGGERLERSLLEAVNGALRAARNEAARGMEAVAAGMGLDAGGILNQMGSDDGGRG